MKKLLLFLGLLFLAMPQITNAAVSVNISNSEGTNKVSIDSDSSTSVRQSGSTTIKTDVVINQNGEKTEYHTTNGEDVNYKSSDGKTSVNINNNASGSPKSSSTPKPSTSPPPDATQSANPSPDVLGVKQDIEDIKQENKNLMDWIKEFFENIFKH